MKLISALNLNLPLIGTVQAGKTIGWPNPAEEETHDTIDLAALLQVDMYASKLFRVKGDSMIEDGIYEEDILLVEATDKYRLGDLVIAEIDGDEMVKYIKKDRQGRLFLQAANKKMKDIYPEEYLKVKAVVKSVIRNLR